MDTRTPSGKRKKGFQQRTALRFVSLVLSVFMIIPLFTYPCEGESCDNVFGMAAAEAFSARQQAPVASAPARVQVISPSKKFVTMNATLKEYGKERYNKILKKVNKVLKKKKFSKLACQFVRDGVEQIYKNYPEWYAVYKDLPTIEEYVDETIIPGLKHASNIEMIDIQSKEATKMRNSGRALAATRGNECDVYLIYNNPKTCTEEEHVDDLELLFHELKHCKDKKSLFKRRRFEGDSDINELYLEGGATFHMKFMRPLTSYNAAAAYIMNEKEDKSINYGKDFGTGYMLQLYIYENMVYLAGYDTVEEVGRGADFTSIFDRIAKKYGKQMAYNLRLDLENLFFGYLYSNFDNDTFKLAIRVQNEIFDCIKRDIKKLDVKKPKQIRKFMEVYRNYKVKIMPEIVREIPNHYTTTTTKYFDTDTLDDLLIHKIIKSGAFPAFSSNKNLNKMALKTILFGTNSLYTTYGYGCLPSSIAHTDYKYYEENGLGHMLMNYRDYNGPITMQVTFNEKKVLKVEEVYIY